MSIKELRTESYYTVYKWARFTDKSAEIFLLIPFGAVSLIINASAFLSFLLYSHERFCNTS